MTVAIDLTQPAEARGEAPPRGRLHGRRLLVVGAGTSAPAGHEEAVGNGQAIAMLAGREGAAVACADRDAAAAGRTAAAIRAAGDGDGGGGTAHVLEADVADAGACAELAATASDALGGLDGIVFNVGILGPFGLAETDPAAWDRAFATNVRSHALIAGAALPLLADGSALVFVGSISSLLPGIGMPAYDVTKSAVLGLMRHVALEGAPRRVRANAVLPGVVDTPLGTASAPAGKRERSRLTIPLGRRGTAWDVAHAAIFLLSGESAYVSGQQLVVDGGLTTLRLGS